MVIKNGQLLAHTATEKEADLVCSQQDGISLLLLQVGHEEDVAEMRGIGSTTERCKLCSLEISTTYLCSACEGALMPHALRLLYV